jgi:Na+-translocating ferredoxin:NAD+ oxidoreductase RnfG subunit
MDSVTTAVIAAISTGLSGAVGDLAKGAIVESYGALKALLRSKFGSDSPVVRAVEGLESKPDSAARRTLLSEEMTDAQTAADPEILAAAQALLMHIRSLPDGGQHIQQVQGDFNAVADRGSTASINVSGPVGKKE